MASLPAALPGDCTGVGSGEGAGLVSLLSHCHRPTVTTTAARPAHQENLHVCSLESGVMQTTDLGSKETGKIWHRKPTPAPSDGIIVNLVHGAVGSQEKTMRFLQVAFDGSGDCFLAGDHLGSIYLFNLNRNRFDLVQRTQQACTALAFNLHRKSEFLVALADYSVKCFDTDNKELVSWMRGHDSSITSISVHGSGSYAVTTSSETAQLWDLDTFQRKRKLNVRQSVGIQKVFFLPLSNTILSCFKDNSIFAWESDTLTCRYQLPAPESGTVFQYKAFAITRYSH